MNINFQAYAIALYSLTNADKKIVSEYCKQLNTIKEVILETIDFTKFINNYSIDKKTRKIFVFDVLSKINIDTNIIYWLWIIIDKNNVEYLLNIINIFIDYSYSVTSDLKVIIYSAMEIENKTLELIKEKITNITKKDIFIQLIIDPKLIGGIKIKIGSKTYDNTVLGKLENIKQAIKNQGEING